MAQNIQQVLQNYINETGKAHFEMRRGVGYGVVFHDENEFILLADLAYNGDLGFFKVAGFPDAPREAEYTPPPVKWVTARLTEPDGVEPPEGYAMWAIIPDDGTNGFIIGEWDNVIAAYQALARLVIMGQADEQVSQLDERLGHRWLSITEAAQEYMVPVDTLRYAASKGRIEHSKKEGNEWRFPLTSFRKWFASYRPRQTKEVMGDAAFGFDGGDNE